MPAPINVSEMKILGVLRDCNIDSKVCLEFEENKVYTVSNGKEDKYILDNGELSVIRGNLVDTIAPVSIAKFSVNTILIHISLLKAYFHELYAAYKKDKIDKSEEYGKNFRSALHEVKNNKTYRKMKNGARVSIRLEGPILYKYDSQDRITVISLEDKNVNGGICFFKESQVKLYNDIDKLYENIMSHYNDRDFKSQVNDLHEMEEWQRLCQLLK